MVHFPPTAVIYFGRAWKERRKYIYGSSCIVDPVQLYSVPNPDPGSGLSEESVCLGPGLVDVDCVVASGGTVDRSYKWIRGLIYSHLGSGFGL